MTSGQVKGLDIDADQVRRIGYITGIGIVHQVDAAVFALNPGAVAVIGPGLLRRVVGVNLYHAIALILVGESAGCCIPFPAKIRERRIAQLIRNAPPKAAAACAPLTELSASHRVAAVKVASGRLFTEDTSVQNRLAVQLNLQPSTPMTQRDLAKARHIGRMSDIMSAAPDRYVIGTHLQELAQAGDR